MINLKIDPEFQNQIPPLTDDEYKQLEENILKEGKLLSPLIVWNNTLVDGHNRYAILQKHPEICFSTMPLRFESREEVLAWICKNQLGRRNLTPEQKLFLIGKQYEAEKSSHGEARKESHDENGRFHRSSQTDNSGEAMKTCERIAEENGVSKATVLRASKYMKGVEIAECVCRSAKARTKHSDSVLRSGTGRWRDWRPHGNVPECCTAPPDKNAERAAKKAKGALAGGRLGVNELL